MVTQGIAYSYSNDDSGLHVCVHTLRNIVIHVYLLEHTNDLYPNIQCRKNSYDEICSYLLKHFETWSPQTKCLTLFSDS